MLKNIVVDQNVLRKEHLLRPAIAAAAAAGEKIVIPDIAFAEMMKSAEWASTTEHSLAILAEDPELVVVSHAIGPVMKAEEESGEACTDIIDHDVTPVVRSLLQEIRQGRGPIFDRVAALIGPAQDLAKAQHFEHSRNKQVIERIVAAWKEELSPDDLKKLRRGDDESFVVELLADMSMIRTCRDALIGAGYEEKKANVLAFEPSVSAHNFLCLAAYGVRWIDGLDSAAPEGVTNDLADMDYIVTASLSRDLVSEEKRVRQIHERLKRVIERRAVIYEDIVNGK